MYYGLTCFINNNIKEGVLVEPFICHYFSDVDLVHTDAIFAASIGHVLT